MSVFRKQTLQFDLKFERPGILKKDEQTFLVRAPKFTPSIKQRRIRFDDVKHLPIEPRGILSGALQSFRPGLEAKVGLAHRDPDTPFLKIQIGPIR